MATVQVNRSDPQIHFLQSEAVTNMHNIFSRISISQSKIFDCPKHAYNSLQVMETYFHDQRLTDVTLVAGTQRIAAHRLVLSAASDYFAAMFTSSLKESMQNQIELVGIDGKALLALVQYCYTGCIELREENLETIFGTACLLQLNPVVEACCQFLLSELDPGNCLGIKMFADAQGCTDLSNMAQTYIINNFVEVIKDQEFLSLSVEEVTKLLESDDVNVPSEETIFHALMTWLRHNSGNQTKDVSNLLSYVRLPLLSPTFISNYIENDELFKSSNIAQNLIMEAYKYHLLPEHRLLFQSGRVQPRKSAMDVPLSIGPTSINAFSLKNNAWRYLASISNMKTCFNAAVLEQRLVVVGGWVADKATNSVESFNFSSLSWDELPPMNMNRSSLGLAELEGSLYAVGGFNSRSILDSVERWNPVVHGWNDVAPMRGARSGAGVAVLNNKLYAIGGWNNSIGLNTVEKYDPETNTWTYCAPMSKRRRKISTSVGILNEYLYVLGGYDDPEYLDSVERYNTITDTWSKVAPMSVARGNVGVCTLGDRLFAVGGSNHSGDLTLVEVYDPFLNRWQEVSSLEVNWSGPCVVIKNSILQS